MTVHEQQAACTACGLPHDAEGWPAEVCRRVRAYGGVYAATRPDPGQAAPEQADLRAPIEAIRAELTRTVHPEWRDVHPIGVLLGEIDQRDAKLAALREQLDARPACLCYPHPADHEDDCLATARPSV